MRNDRDREVKEFVTEEYFKNDDNLRDLFEDYIELNSFHELVEEVLRKTVENLLAGDGIDRPAKAWAAAERSFPELGMIRMLSLAEDESIDRFCEYNGLSELQSMNLNAWIYGYGRILHEVFRKVSIMDVSVMNPFTKVDFDPFWPTKLGLRVYLKIFGEESSFETVDSPSRLMKLSSLIVEAVAKSFKWKGTTVKEYRRSLDEIDKLIFSLSELQKNLAKDMNDQINHLKEVEVEELIDEE